MEILNRYLAQIERNLPPAKRSDIVAQIAAELQLQFAQREIALGHSLSADDAAEIIRAFGSPRAVAGRYADHQYLIGPELLPFYWHTMRILIVASIVVLMFVGIARAVAFNDASVFLKVMAAGWEDPVWVFGFVTVIFALFEHFGKREAQQWDPRTLPPIRKDTGVPRMTLAFDLLGNLGLLFVVLVFASRWAGVHTSIWQPIYIAIIASCCINTIAVVVVLARPAWGRVRLFGQIAASTVNLVGLFASLHAIGPAQPQLRVFLTIFVVVVGFTGLNAIWKLVRDSAQEKHSPGVA
ncbi:MAG: HAAS signaling domain-containing protein [Vulcanimicrobiaceae bacterium]